MNRTLVISMVLAAAAGCKRHEAAQPAPQANAPTGNMMGQPMAPAPGGTGMMAPGAMGGAMPMMAPGAAAPGGGSCAQYATCCNAIAAMPNMAAMSAACAQVQQLSNLGPQGEQACAMALQGLRPALAAMPNAPAACAGGGGGSMGMMQGAVPPTAPGMMGGNMMAGTGGMMGGPAGAGAAGAAQPIGVGAVAQGVLATTDQQVQGHAADDFAINLMAGQPVTIVTRGGPSPSDPNSTVDVQTSLICNGQEVASDDDSAGNNNSRIVYTPTANGACTIRVSGFGGATGPYVVQTYAGALNNQS